MVQLTSLPISMGSSVIRLSIVRTTAKNVGSQQVNVQVKIEQSIA